MLPSIIKNPLVELANLRQIHETSIISNKKFQPDVEEQRKLIVNQITKKIILFTIKQEKIKYLHNVKLKSMSMLENEDDTLFMDDDSNGNSRNNYNTNNHNIKKYSNKLRPYTTSTLSALHKDSNSNNYVATRRPFTTSLIETVYDEDFHDELFNEVSILHKDSKAFFDGLFNNSIGGSSSSSGGGRSNRGKGSSGSSVAGSVAGGSVASGSVGSNIGDNSSSVNVGDHTSNIGSNGGAMSCIACQFSAKRNFEVIDVNNILSKPVMSGKSCNHHHNHHLHHHNQYHHHHHPFSIINIIIMIFIITNIIIMFFIITNIIIIIHKYHIIIKSLLSPISSS